MAQDWYSGEEAPPAMVSLEQQVREALRTAGHPELHEEGTGADWRIVSPGWHAFIYQGQVRVGWWSEATLCPDPAASRQDEEELAALRPALEAVGLPVTADVSVLAVTPPDGIAGPGVRGHDAVAEQGPAAPQHGGPAYMTDPADWTGSPFGPGNDEPLVERTPDGVTTVEHPDGTRLVYDVPGDTVTVQRPDGDCLMYSVPELEPGSPVTIRRDCPEGSVPGWFDPDRGRDGSTVSAVTFESGGHSRVPEEDVDPGYRYCEFRAGEGDPWSRGWAGTEEELAEIVSEFLVRGGPVEAGPAVMPDVLEQRAGAPEQILSLNLDDSRRRAEIVSAGNLIGPRTGTIRDARTWLGSITDGDWAAVREAARTVSRSGRALRVSYPGMMPRILGYDYPSHCYLMCSAVPGEIPGRPPVQQAGRQRPSPAARARRGGSPGHQRRS